MIVTSIKVPSGASDPDPTSSPEDVPDERILNMSRTVVNTDESCKRLIFSSDVAMTFSLWALIEDSTIPGNTAQISTDRTAKADRRYVLIKAAIAVIADTALVYPLIADESALPPGGAFYIQATTGPASDAVLSATCGG